MSDKVKLTERELSIMHVFWEREEATIADVHDQLNGQGNDLAYTSVATIVRILEDKGVLEITKNKRPFRYRPVLGFKQVSRNIVDDLVNRLFGGSRSKLLAHLAEDEELSEKEIAAIKKLLKRNSE